MLHAADRWLVGLFMALANCALSSIGFTLQRKSHLLSEQEKVQQHSYLETNASAPALEKKPRPAIKGLWITGVVLYILAAVPDVVAYAMVPMVVCTTVACFRLVVVTCLAHFFLNERVQRREFLGMVLCTLGTFLCLTFGPRPPQTHETAAAGELYHPEVIPYVMLGFGVLLLLMGIEYSELCGCAPLSDRIHYSILPVVTGLAFGIEKVFNSEIGFLEAPKQIPQDMLEYPEWTAMAISIGLLGITDFCLNMRGAQRCPVQIFVPASFAFGTALQYLQSVLLFGELRRMSTHDAVLSVFGCCCSLLGAVCIQPPLSESSGGHKLIEPQDSSRDSLDCNIEEGS